MIIVGYQGIGKSTLSGRSSGYVDLESGNFWVDGKRPDDWYRIYANMADHLSKQGFNVFTSSHQIVREALKSSTEKKVIVCPSVELKEPWIKRLQDRYDTSGLEKDYKALMNAKDRYTENITELLVDDAFVHVVINSMDYDLHELIERVDTRPRLTLKDLDRYCSVNDALSVIVKLFGSEDINRSIEACQYESKSDFSRGVMFGISQAGLFMSLKTPSFYGPKQKE